METSWKEVMNSWLSKHRLTFAQRCGHDVPCMTVQWLVTLRLPQKCVSQTVSERSNLQATYMQECHALIEWFAKAGDCHYLQAVIALAQVIDSTFYAESLQMALRLCSRRYPLIRIPLLSLIFFLDSGCLLHFSQPARDQIAYRNPKSTLSTQGWAPSTPSISQYSLEVRY
jgi:hypothetical protein